MVEPTESEDLDELDRFIDAMIAIRVEIDRVAAGAWSVEASPLRRAPHTAAAVVGEWERPYSREKAAFPAGPMPNKYWPPVAKAFIAPTDTDFTGPISTLTKADAKLVAVMSTAPQLATLMSSADSASLDALWVGASPSIFVPSLLDGPAKRVLEDNLVIGSGQAPWAADSEAAQKVRDLYEKAGSKVAPQSSIMTGYAQAEIFAAVLEKACEDGDLTREGILKTFQSMDPVDTGGLVSTLDFTRGKGKSQSLETAILKPTSSVDGGLEQVEAAFTSDEVKNGGY